ncbi:hypothetical protein [Catellatospora sichuanensis]|uniref:hypothetical protein n=1 Tax=Catellatospora sichuanensis TaxID=1969805 RepID=UPI0011832B50|nr:hypothetical protein [Catellatospora sichuanensis]
MNASAQTWSSLNVEAIELIEEDWPGWVRVRLVDADGVPRIFEGKLPIFFAGDVPTSSTTLPVPAMVRCHVLRRELLEDGRAVLIVSTAIDGVETGDGLDEFRVREDQVEVTNG